jgi:hypothetical protein
MNSFDRKQISMRLLARLAVFLHERVILLAVMLSGVLALIGLSAHVTGHDPSAGLSSRPSSGIPSRVEVRTIYVDPALVLLSKLPPGSVAIESHDGLCEHLRARGSETVWYAITTQGFGPGGATNMSSFCRPCESPERFEQFLDVLDTAAGKPPQYPGMDYSTARVVVIPHHLARQEPREAIAGVLGLSGSSDLP